MAPVDLFSTRHAEKVLAAFGRAFGTLPDNISETTKDEKEFLKQSVAGLAEEGKVISVRLALFAAMMKGREWTPATLKEVGGTKGVGVTFLAEAFSAHKAVPRHRLHQKAARAVLKSLLPHSDTDIKGHMRSYAELLEASGYGNRPRDFDDLIRILDSEIRLITPTGSLTSQHFANFYLGWLDRFVKESSRVRGYVRYMDDMVLWHASRETLVEVLAR